MSIVIVSGIPVSDCPDKPEDLPNAFLINCPKCNEKMWFTKNKNLAEVVCVVNFKKYIKACHKCIMKEVEKNPEDFQGLEMLKIEHA